VTLRDIACGPGTVLGCGEAEGAVFLGKEVDDPSFTTGYGFRVRKGSLYEEDANSAQHTDTKMTILFPWVTLGSNINWCDVLVAGGTGPGLGEFTEVGSGTIHFNFTPRGDKATASAFGNVVEGVFLDRSRLFLGGNGSMIGPLSAAFGAVSVAGGRHTRPLHPGLNTGDEAPSAATAEGFDLEIYGSVSRVFAGQVTFIAELAALQAWYAQARPLVAQGSGELEEIYRRGTEMVALNISERIAQLARLAGAMERSAALLEKRAPADPRIAQQRTLHDGWATIEAALRAGTQAEAPLPDALRSGLRDGAEREGRVYTRVVQKLSPQAVEAGRAWLRSARERAASPEVLGAVPPLGSTP
jgi:UDP-N-acetylglucosamine/UDP-N-acetylgalactosamine diphosphorylase